MNLTKRLMAEKIQNELNTSRLNSVDLVETVLALIKEPLSSGEDVLISGFGKFCVKKKNLVGGSQADYPLPTERLVPAR